MKKSSSIRDAADRVWCGYPRVSVFRVSGLVLVFRPRFSGSGLGLVSGSVSVLVSTRGYPMDIRNKSFGIKTHVYNILMITCLLRLLNLLKVDS